jgi:UPF0271 protein
MHTEFKPQGITNLSTKPCIDLNCDVGEGFGVYSIGNDDALLKLATSVNIACGFHGGDAAVMRRTVRLAVENGVAIGAHPGLPDLAGFGRRTMNVSAQEVYDLTLYQIGALDGFARAAGGSMIHVKPHGALYNMLAANGELSEAFAQAVKDFDEKLILVGLAASALTEAGEKLRLRTAHEAFADRSYQPDGTLTPRSRPDALMHSTGEVVAQAVGIALHGRAFATDGSELLVKAHTICLHGDSPDSAKSARAVVRGLRAAGIDVRSLVR